MPLLFGDFPEQFRAFEKARIVLLPIPFDLTTSWGKGADKGPEALLHASYYLENYNCESGVEIHELGIAVDSPVLAEDSLTMVEMAAHRVAELVSAGKFVVSLGGEHTVTVGPVRALAERHPGMGILHLDAHSDRRDSYEGNPYSHACAMARCRESVETIVSVGVRSVDSSELDALRQTPVFYAHEIHNQTDWVERVVDALPPEVYVTVDLDVFDQAIMPSTGTPEPGGLGWYDLTALLGVVAQRRTVTGFDVVELAPTHQKGPDFLAAKLVQTFLGFLFASELTKLQ